jgi:pyruvate dehydrogenase (quinone)
MAKTAADQIAEMMIDAGIRRVYGVVGDSINPIVDAIRRSDGKLRWVHCRNEEVGAFAAGADALLTGQIAACAGSCGPGNLHLIQGLYNSHRNRAPVFAIAGQVPTRFLGTEYFQETFRVVGGQLGKNTADRRSERGVVIPANWDFGDYAPPKRRTCRKK